MTNQPATEALLACIRDVAGCTTGWSTYRPDRIAWLLTTRHPPSRRIRPECHATVHYTQKARGKLTTNDQTIPTTLEKMLKGRNYDGPRNC